MTIADPVVVETRAVAVLPEVTVETPKVAVEAPKAEYDADESDNDSGDEDMTYFTMNGAKFGYDEDNTLYFEGDDEFSILGTWDPSAKKPVFEDEDEARNHGWIQ